jgi:hypothetical protein
MILISKCPGKEWAVIVVIMKREILLNTKLAMLRKGKERVGEVNEDQAFNVFIPIICNNNKNGLV